MFYLFVIRNIYTSALDALGKSRRPVEALNIFHAMQVIHAKSLFLYNVEIWATSLTFFPFLPATNVLVS